MPQRANPTEDEIRVRAYEIFIRRQKGGQEGDHTASGDPGGTPETDWLLAEAELRGQASEAAGHEGSEGRSPGSPPPKKSTRTVRSTTASRRSR